MVVLRHEEADFLELWTSVATACSNCRKQGVKGNHIACTHYSCPTPESCREMTMFPWDCIGSILKDWDCTAYRLGEIFYNCQTWGHNYFSAKDKSKVESSLAGKEHWRVMNLSAGTNSVQEKFGSFRALPLALWMQVFEPSEYRLPGDRKIRSISVWAYA